MTDENTANPDARPDQVEAIFAAALDQPPADRAAWVARACGADGPLAAEVAALLGAAGAAAGLPFAAPSLGDVATANAPSSAMTRAGDRVGPYKLLEQIGEGGFGVVFMAEQERPVRRTVAVKVIKLGMDTKEVVARFEAERQALALMDHPNIARVLDAGATEAGRPYFVMEFVRGSPITDYCDKHHLTAAERAGLVAEVCRAVQHAHGKGVIHRDIKPSNVLVTVADDRPIAKVIDFGIAKAMQPEAYRRGLSSPDSTSNCSARTMYMSPEQADSSRATTSTRGATSTAWASSCTNCITGDDPVRPDGPDDPQGGLRRRSAG